MRLFDIAGIRRQTSIGMSLGGVGAARELAISWRCLVGELRQRWERNESLAVVDDGEREAAEQIDMGAVLLQQKLQMLAVSVVTTTTTTTTTTTAA